MSGEMDEIAKQQGWYGTEIGIFKSGWIACFEHDERILALIEACENLLEESTWDELKFSERREALSAAVKEVRP